MIYIIGHKNPDTDSVVSAIALAELEKMLGNNQYQPAIPNPINKETTFVLKKFGFACPVEIPAGDKEVVLVDHNEVSQISNKVNYEEIIRILDHHKLGGLTTINPIPVLIKPLGSSASIIAEIFKKNNLEIPKNIASLLLAAILSDTLKFTSPTTTKEDKKIVESLNKIAKVDLEKLAESMFQARSSLDGVSVKDLLGNDCKEFQMGKYKVGIGVFETVDLKPALEMKEQIFKEIPIYKKKNNFDFLFFGVVDIIKQKTYVFVDDKEEEKVITSVFGISSQDGVATLDGVVSRKKQITPPLEKYFEHKR